MNRFGYSEAKWTSAKNEAKQILIERARVRGMIPYSELAQHIHAIPIEAHDPRLFNLLGDMTLPDWNGHEEKVEFQTGA